MLHTELATRHSPGRGVEAAVQAPVAQGMDV